MLKNRPLITGAFILTVTGFITRFMGFFFRIFLSQTFGEEQVGLYQLVLPIYSFCFSLSTAGLETALSRCTAQSFQKAHTDKANAVFIQAISVSLFLSIFLMFFIRRFSSAISILVIGDLRTEPLLRLVSFALPFASIHNCISGYYLGQKKTAIPAFAQFIEQLGRISSIMFIYYILTHKELVSIKIAVLGLVFGEIFSALFCIRCTCKKITLTPSFLRVKSDLLITALPLTSSRILTNLLQSLEAVSIPIQLQKYGLSNAESLSTYGVLTGMALPCILFPTSITNSISSVLLPAIAEIQSSKDNKRLTALVQKVLFFGSFLGFLFLLFFYICSTWIGSLLFQSSTAGKFLKTLAWICPFLYVNTTLLSILNGLGKVKQTFRINVFCLTLRIIFVFILIPATGIEGYLWGLLLSQILTTALGILSLFKQQKGSFS